MQAPIGAGRTPGKLAAGGRFFRLLPMAALSLMGALGIEEVNAQAASPMSSERLSSISSSGEFASISSGTPKS